MTDDSNRRRAPRTRVVAVASLETRGVLNANDQALCVVRDMSRTGIGLETGQPPLVGQRVILRLVLDDESHELRTRATRVQRRGKGNFYQVGLDWSECAADELAFLDRVLEAYEQQPHN
jgi:hypothetical protein